MRKNISSTSFYLLYGLHSSIAALQNPARQIKKVICTQQIFDKYAQIIQPYPYEILNISKINLLLPQNAVHQGIVVNIRQFSSYNLSDITIDDNAKIAILDQLNDPHNIGAIIRSAAAFNIDTIIVSDDHSPDENAIIAKSACGGLEAVKIIRASNISACINSLKKMGFWIIGMDSNTEEYFTSKIIKGKIAVVLGSEGQGLRRLTKENCDFLVKLPISPKSESLNVSNAAAIIFYEMFKIQE